MRTLLTNGSVYSPADPHATAIAFDDGVVSWLGDDTSAAAYADGADEVIDLRGKLVAPAFVDAHVHTAQTGALLTGLDLSGTANLTEALDRLKAFAADLPADAVIDGAGWDETKWPEGTAADLRGAGPRRRRPPRLPLPRRRPLRCHLVVPQGRPWPTSPSRSGTASTGGSSAMRTTPSVMH